MHPALPFPLTPPPSPRSGLLPEDLPLQFLDHMRPLAVTGVREPHVTVCGGSWKLVAKVMMTRRVVASQAGPRGGEAAMATMPANGDVGARRGECEGGTREGVFRGFESELRPARLALLQATTCLLVGLASFRSVLFCVEVEEFRPNSGAATYTLDAWRSWKHVIEVSGV